MSLLAAIFLVLALFLGWRLRALGRIIRELQEAAEHGEPLLLERNGPFIRGYRLDRLVRSVNQLLAEHRKASGSGDERHNQIQAVLGNLREAVVMVDAEHTILSANPAFRELVSAGENPQGLRLDTCIRGSAFLELLEEIRRDGTGRSREMEVQIGKQLFWLEVSAARVRVEPRPDRFHTLFVFHDITRQKKLEKMRTDFVANVSHELRTPVTIIKGFAQTLIEDQEELTPEEKTRFLEKIRGNSERLHSLLQDLLLLSRLESTEMVLQRERVSLSGFLQDLAETFRSSLDPQTQSLKLELAEGNDVVFVDPLRLSQVLNNLLDNVIRHARGFREIRIRTELEPDALLLTVADDGQGIPEKDLPHIFQRFYRVEKGRSRESGGTGLGLSIVKHIVVQHGGRIEARSGKGEGTRILIRLPLPQAETGEASSHPVTSGTTGGQ
ncbi:MAG: sensor histidine kinase [Oceanipulchritudo sp.]